MIKNFAKINDEEKAKLLKKRESERKAIKKSLYYQLEKLKLKGVKYAENLVDDYLNMYDIQNELIDDIAKRGVTVSYQNGKDQIGFKKNDSISEYNKTNQQMIKILTALGISPAVIANTAEDDDDEM